MGKEKERYSCIQTLIYHNTHLANVICGWTQQWLSYYQNELFKTKKQWFRTNTSALQMPDVKVGVW